MGHFNKWLTWESAAFPSVAGSEDDEDDEEAGPLESLQSAIIESLVLYVDKDEEPFQPFTQTFCQAVWSRVAAIGQRSRYDELVTTSIRFLSIVVSKHWNAGLFRDESVLRTIV